MIEILILLLAFPVGLLVAYMSRDELVIGRRWFTLLFIVSFLAGFWLFLIDKNAEMYSSFFISIVALTSYIKSFDKKWSKK